MIQIGFPFIIVAVLSMALGYAVPLFLLLVSVTLHELAHMAVAKYFGGRVSGIRFTPLGEAAVIRGMELMPVGSRLLTFAAGPAVNLLLAAGAYAAGALPFVAGHAFLEELLRQAGFYNLLLCVFNLLPIFPLDGGRLLQIILGNHIGVPLANRFIIRLGRMTGLLFILPGLMQVVLFPYNISLFCMGIYLWRLNGRVALPLTHEFLQAMLGKPAQLMAKGALPVRTLAVCAAYPLTRVVDRLGWDVLTCLTLDGDHVHFLTEYALMQYIAHNGLGGTVGDAFVKID